MTVLLVRFGELSVAVTARSTRSKVDQETDPDELALNWIPPHVNGELVPLKVNVMGLAAVPAAMSRPSMKRCTPESNFTVVPGVIVNVRGARTVTGPATMQARS